MKPLMRVQVMYVMLLGTGVDYSELDMVVQIAVMNIRRVVREQDLGRWRPVINLPPASVVLAGTSTI